MKTFDMGDVIATAAVFTFGPDSNSKSLLIVTREPMTHAERLDRFGHDAKGCVGVHLDDSGSKFYAIWVEDCFDPPIAIVRADHEQDALDTFVDKLDWAHVSEPDLADYTEDQLSYGPNGQPYDGESIGMLEVKLVRIECI